MKLKYLGTGAAEGMPALFCRCPVCARSMAEGGKSLRMRSCTLLNDEVLLDLSPDIYAQKLRFGLGLDRLKAIVFTHSHPDHEDSYALQLRATASCSIRPGVSPSEDVLALYGNQWVRERFEKALAEAEHADKERFCFHEVCAFEPFTVGSYTFHPLRANHRPIAVEDCVIYAVTDGKTAFLYANDTGELSPENDAYLAKTGLCFSVVSMDCARGLLPGDGHMGFQECLALRERLQKIGVVSPGTRYILNHLSHMNDMTHQEWKEFAAPYRIEIAWDGLDVDTEATAAP
ncbi:MAG: MBL fold metallo-hydrolase [Eubacteriales bacterium]|nr:MBL fold metallo-hydrolase [Eubacteriales bacterium]